MLESRATLCILAMATLVATIWTGTDGARDATTLRSYLADFAENEKTKIPASLINYERDLELQFQKAASSNKNVNDLLLQGKPTLSVGQRHTICGNDFGIQCNNGGQHVFCDLHTISLEIFADEEGDDYVVFILHFQSQSTDQLKLYVPVFERPRLLFTTSDPRNIQNWAIDNNIESLSPVKYAELSSLASNDIVTFQFGWLDRLVSYGLYRSHRSGSNKYSAWTYPLVLESKITDEFKKCAKNFKDFIRIR